MQPPLALRRLGYRVAHRLLRGWWFIRRPTQHGVKCVLTNGDSVLLVRHTYGRRQWDFPGGTPRRGEPPLSAARREMEEELGVAIDGLRPIGEIHASPYHARDTLHCFHAELSEIELQIDRGELAAAHWFPRAQLPRDINRYVLRILTLAG
jgi:8-oxo-dGTP pyrophosphatase MutT (NUDIX family)